MASAVEPMAASTSPDKSVQTTIKRLVRQVHGNALPNGPGWKQPHSPWQEKEPPNWGLTIPWGSSQPRRGPTTEPRACGPRNAVLSTRSRTREQTAWPHLRKSESQSQSGKRFPGRARRGGPGLSRDVSRSECRARGVFLCEMYY